MNRLRDLVSSAIPGRDRRRFRLGRRPFAVALLASIAIVVIGAGVAYAYFQFIDSSNAHTAKAVAGSLSAPTTPTATVNGSGAITIGWTLPGTQLSGAQYKVARTSGPGSPTAVCTVASTVTSCQDTGLTIGTTYGYSVMAVRGTNWQSSAITTSATTATPTFAITLSAGPYAAGAPITLQTITAKIGPSTDTTYTGSKTIDWSGLTNSPSNQAPSYPSSSATFVNGVASPSSTFTAYSAGSNTLVGADHNATSVTGSANFTLNAATVNKYVFTTSAVSGAASAGANLGPITVQEQDVYGNPTTTAETVTLSSDSAGTYVFNTTQNATSPTGATTVSIPGGSSSATFYYGDTKAGSPLIKAHTTGLTDATQTETITVAAANKLAFTSTTSGNKTVASTATVGPFVVQVQDTFGNPVPNTGSAATVTLSSTSTGTSFFTTTSGGSSASAVTIANGASSSASFFYSDTKAGTPTINASATVNGQAISGNTSGFTMVAAAANKLAFTTQAVAGATSGTASLGPITVEVEDSFGNPVVGARTVNLSSTNSGTAHFATTQGATGASTLALSIGAGSSSGNFFYGNATAGTQTITAASTSPTTITSATQQETIGPNKLVITSTALSGAATNSPTLGPITVQLQDAGGTPITTGATVNLSSNSTGTKVFSATSGGTTTSSVTISGGSSSVNFFYGDTLAGTPTITAAASGVTSGTQQETINGGAPTTLVFTNCSKNGGAAGSCGGSVAVGNGGTLDATVSLVDAFGNAPTVSAGSTWSVTVTSSSSQFVVTLSPVTITGPASQSSSTFHVHYTSSGAASATLTAHATSGSPSVADGTMTVSK